MRSIFHALDTNLHGAAQTWLVGEHAGDGCRRSDTISARSRLFPLVRAFARAKAFDVAKHATGEKPAERRPTLDDFEFSNS